MLKSNEYIPRYLEKTVAKLAKSFKVVYVGGPRQVGKTTLLQHLTAKRNVNYVTLDDVNQRELARRDPEYFLEQYRVPVFIDEVQYAPELFSAIKVRVDKTNDKGLYYLSGSQQFALMKNMQESLAGRVGIMSLLGFSMAEIKGIKFYEKPFFPTGKQEQLIKISQIELWEMILRGSFPALWQADAPPLAQFYNSYLQTYIDRDLVDIFGLTKVREFNTFIQLCAARTGQMLNYSELARDAGISVHAAREWLALLSQTMQVYLLEPYHNNFSKRLIKTPKLYFLDTGLAAHLTRWQTAETLSAGAMAGAFFETWIVSEIIKSYLFRGIEPPIYYFRDKEGHEVDILFEREQKIYPLEIKLRSQVKIFDIKNIDYLRQRLLKKMKQGAVMCMSSEKYSLTRDLTVLPPGTII